MSKEQVIYGGKAQFSCKSIGGLTTKFIFSVDEFKQIKITLEYDKDKTHIEIDHTINDNFVQYLIDWLIENNPNK